MGLDRVSGHWCRIAGTKSQRPQQTHLTTITQHATGMLGRNLAGVCSEDMEGTAAVGISDGGRNVVTHI